MAIQRIERKKGTVYRVKWRDEAGKWQSKTFDRVKNARDFEGSIRVAKRRGELDDLDRGKQPLEEFIAEWWKLDAEPRLARSTLDYYAWLRDKHIIPRLGRLELRRVTPEALQRFQQEMLGGGTGQVTTRKALVLLQGIFERAVEWRRLASNPARAVRKPPAARTIDIVPVSPRAVEEMRANLRRDGRLRDATLVSLLAYSGMRPGEALALTWGDVKDNGIRVTKRVSLGEVQDGAKSRQRSRRTVELLKPLGQDLNEWRLASGRPDDGQLVFPRADGAPWKKHDYHNWRADVFRPVARSVGLEGTRIYDLRHSFASLLLAEGRNPVEVAEQLGHAPSRTLDTYAHVIADLRGGKEVRAEAEIHRARETACGPNVARPGAAESGA